MFIQKRKEAFNEKPPFFLLFLSDRRGSNPRPAAWEAAALPTELLSHCVTATLLHVETDVQDVAILHHIVFAFHRQFTGFFAFQL